MEISKLKRQAEILGKECSLQHSAALELASKLNGFKNWHEAKLVLEREVQMEDKANDWSSKMDASLKYIKTAVKPLIGNQYEVKVKALAEMKTYFEVFADNPQDAIKQVREKLDALDHYSMDYNMDWEISYIMNDHGFKITDVYSSTDEKNYLQDDSKGVEENPVEWHIY